MAFPPPNGGYVQIPAGLPGAMAPPLPNSGPGAPFLIDALSPLDPHGLQAPVPPPAQHPSLFHTSTPPSPKPQPCPIDQASMLEGSQPNKKQKFRRKANTKCLCGATNHVRITYTGCPLNKRRTPIPPIQGGAAAVTLSHPQKKKKSSSSSLASSAAGPAAAAAAAAAERTPTRDELLLLFDMEVANAIKFLYFPAWPRPRPVEFRWNYHDAGIHKWELYARAIRLFGPPNQQAVLAREQVFWKMRDTYRLGPELVSIIRQMVLLGEHSERWSFWPGTTCHEKERPYEAAMAWRLGGGTKAARRRSKEASAAHVRRMAHGFFHPLEVTDLGKLTMMISGGPVHASTALRSRIETTEDAVRSSGLLESPLMPPHVDRAKPHSLVIRVDLGHRAREQVLAGCPTPHNHASSKRSHPPQGFITVPNDCCVSTLGEWLKEHFGKALKGRASTGWHFLEVFDRRAAAARSEVITRLCRPLGRPLGGMPPVQRPVNDMFVEENAVLDNLGTVPPIPLAAIAIGLAPAVLPAAAAAAPGYYHAPPTPAISIGLLSPPAQYAGPGLPSAHVSGSSVPPPGAASAAAEVNPAKRLREIGPSRTVFFLSHMSRQLGPSIAIPACHTIAGLANNADDQTRVVNEWVRVNARSPQGYWRPTNRQSVHMYSKKAATGTRQGKAPNAPPLFAKSVLGSRDALRKALQEHPDTASPLMPVTEAAKLDPSLGAGRALLSTRPCALADALPSMVEAGHPATVRLSDCDRDQFSNGGVHGLPVVAQFVSEHCGDDVLYLTVFAVKSRLTESRYPVVYHMGRRTNSRRFLDTF